MRHAVSSPPKMASPGRESSQPGLSFAACQPKNQPPGSLQFGKRTHKPNSVLCGHSSRRRVTADTRQRPTRRFRRTSSRLTASGRYRAAAWLGPSASLPIWSCSVWGLPCLRHYCRSGALLPHLFTLTGLAVQAYALRAKRPCRSTRTRRYFLCGTGRPRALTPASRTLSGTLPCGVRTFLSRNLPKRAPAATARSSCQTPVYLEEQPAFR
jgi:hypothetical protein